jgi:excisionase family DNA binding protein
MKMEIITSEDLQVLKAEILEAIRQEFGNHHNLSSTGCDTEEYLSTKQAAAFLGVSVRQLMTYKTEKRIAYSQVGRKLFFRKKDLETFVASHRIPSRYELN